MLENHAYTVVDINAGIGGRTRMLLDQGFQVLTSVENNKACHKLFHALNPGVQCLTYEEAGQDGALLPASDILTADIGTASPSATGRFTANDQVRLISQILLHKRPKLFLFQISASFLKKVSQQFLEAAALRRYRIFYQVFQEAAYSGFPVSGTQAYFVGIRSDISTLGFVFPEPLFHSYDRPLPLEAAEDIDPWYRRLPNHTQPKQSPRLDRLYGRTRQGDIKRIDTVQFSFLDECYYCDDLGLRRLTHQEYATLKGYDRYALDFGQFANRETLYRVLFRSPNVPLFERLISGIPAALLIAGYEVNPEEWMVSPKPPKVTQSSHPEKTKAAAETWLLQPRSQLLKLHITRLKGLQEVDISFSKSLTAIMGVNCSGKSTVLHALACAFQPVSAGQDYKFNFFFTPNSDALWNDSELEMTYLDENTQAEVTRKYQKKSNRWSPKYARRPKREVFFLGIDSCSPEIERERQTSYISYSTDAVENRQAEHIREAISYIMDKQYTGITNNTTRKKTMFGVRTADDLRYSALSMGAGEQRVFKILQLVYSAPAFSLILIDEIDLLLHVKALERLVEKLSDIALKRKIQIVFTTHSLVMRKLTQYVAIQYLYPTPSRTLVFDTITPDIVYSLTNTMERPLVVYVEDDLAETIVKYIISELGISRHTAVKTIGSSENAFTLAAGLVLLGEESFANRLIVLDGDVYRQKEDQKKQLLRKLSGTEADHAAKVEKALSLITALHLPDKTAPERFIHDIIIENGLADDTANEILYCAKQVTVVKDSHDWLNKIVELMCQDRKVTLHQIIQNAASHPRWHAYVADVYQWLKAKKEDLHL